MSPALAQGVDARLDHVRGRVKVRLANFEMDDALALALKGAGLIQNFERGFSAEPRHAAGELQFVLGGLRHDDKTPEEAKRSIIPDRRWRLSPHKRAERVYSETLCSSFCERSTRSME